MSEETIMLFGDMCQHTIAPPVEKVALCRPCIAEHNAELAALREVEKLALVVAAEDGCLYRERYKCDKRPEMERCRRCLMRDALANLDQFRARRDGK